MDVNDQSETDHATNYNADIDFNSVFPTDTADSPLPDEPFIALPDDNSTIDDFDDMINIRVNIAMDDKGICRHIR